MNQLPPVKTMYRALLNRDSSYEGIFYVGVKTAGVFCHPTCTAKNPAPANLELHMKYSLAAVTICEETDMKKINLKRLLLGGLVAGLVMNISEAALHGGALGQDAAELFKSMNIPDSPHPVYLISLIVVTFVIGSASVWLYAAIRPRYGAGPKTAVRAGLAVWVLAHLWSGVYLGAGFAGLIPPKLAWLPVVWGLIEAPLGTLAGAWLYKEAEHKEAERLNQLSLERSN
jgi:hypothetical protein